MLYMNITEAKKDSSVMGIQTNMAGPIDVHPSGFPYPFSIFSVTPYLPSRQSHLHCND